MLLALLAIFGQALLGEATPRQPDERFYLTTASEIAASGTLSTAIARGDGGGGQAPVPDNYIPPLYPMILAGLAAIDPGLRAAMDCARAESIAGMRDAPGPCPEAGFRGLIALQGGLMALGLLGAFAAFRAMSRMAGEAAGERNALAWPAFSWAAFGVLLILGPQGRMAASPLPDGPALAALMGASGLFMQALLRERPLFWLAAGAMIGVAALLRPSALYLVPMLVPFLLLRPGRRWAAGWLALGLGLAIAPYLVRNMIQLDSPAFTGGYGGVILAQRIAFDLMRPDEWLAALVYWLPDFGDSLAAALFDPESYRRLAFTAPDGFYAIGNGPLMEAARARLEADGGESLTGVLIRDWVLERPLAHLAATVPLFLRGLWVGQLAGLIALVLAVPMVIGLARRGAAAGLCWLALPFLLLAGLHAGATINIPRYNLGLTVVHAAIFGYWIVALAGAARRLNPFAEGGRKSP
ncbi:glycosyltransferase family 39 protein [Marivibrio halodurans]|uniref:Glycosyltransferase family 39 protein n=1 Tax=Marivibrio halodurans TaxID=2039722 RepID=A0A8J7S1P9_9PROT|nr:glycosyltransferase family 39 protein [Marivibrio halodurans]MBP5858650.1 glycosyltransferase family 39 protein [Marivibrio halodurans]